MQAERAFVPQPTLVAGTSSVARIVAHELSPLVRAIDEDGVYPEQVLRALGEAGAFGRHLGGLSANGGLLEAIADMAEVGATCLSTAFCVWCQDALVWYLDRAENPVPRERWLEEVRSGRRLGGTGLSNSMKSFSQLDTLALRGARVTGGWRVRGRLPWVSNLGPGHLFASVFAAESEDRAIMAVFDCAASGVSLVDVGPYVALDGTRTYAVLLRDVFVPDETVLADDARQFVPTIRQGFVLLQFGMALGIAYGAARLMRQDARAQMRSPKAELPLDAETIETRAAALAARAAVLARAQDDPSRARFLDTLRARLEGSWLALEAAQAAVLQLGARSYRRHSEAHRRQREAQFVAIVTPSVKHILTELARDR